MPALTDYLSRRGEILVLVLVVVLSVAMMLLSTGAKGTTAHAINDAVITPVQASLTGVKGWNGIRSENDSLRARLARASLEMAGLAERGRAVGRLEEMLAFRERSRFDVVAARIVARGASRMAQEMKIDKGSLDGVRRNLAVVTVDGLVGKVQAVEPRSAFVLPLTGRHCRVSARLTRTRTEGILEWTPARGLQLTFLPFRAEVRAGDEIVSSGLGGVFPLGIAVGTVTRVETDPADGSRRVLVEPAVDFGAVEEVFVVVGQRAERELPVETDLPAGEDTDDTATHAAESAEG